MFSAGIRGWADLSLPRGELAGPEEWWEVRRAWRAVGGLGNGGEGGGEEEVVKSCEVEVEGERIEAGLVDETAAAEEGGWAEGGELALSSSAIKSLRLLPALP
jgi:hypothetical protein